MLKKINNHYPFKTMLNFLDNKFKFEIIYYLLHNKLRFGELKNSLLDINQQLLTKLLKQLENYESYRPDSWSDAVRSPFHRKRYKFFSDED